MREIICRNIVENNFTVDQLFAALFDNDPARCSLEYIQKLGRFLRRDLRFREQYLRGGRLPVGRSFSQDVINRIMIRQHVLDNKNRRCCSMYQDYCAMFYPAGNLPQNVLSLSTFKRILKRGRITRKKIVRRNINQNPIEGVRFLEAIEHIDPRFLIDVDETKHDRESRELKFGYSPEGEECLKDQIVINNFAYSTIAAVTPFGFLAWRIHEGIIDHEAFTAFMVDSVGPFITPEHHLVLDNATIHHYPTTRIALQEVFNGQYWYSAPYSPHLKPVEPCFALVKEWIRNHEDEATLDPVGTIGRAFRMFEIGGELADSIRGHWNGYFENYAGYLENLIA